MCLAVPGRIVEISGGDDQLSRTGKVDFAGVTKNVSLAYVPDAVVGDYVIVHVGFALSKIDPAEAERVFSYLKDMEALEKEGEGK
jgi:hydrogenase expression/formation protein HypC